MNQVCPSMLAASDFGPQLPRRRKDSAPGCERIRMNTILVVDDEPLIRWAVREALESAGYAVVEAGSAREALASLAAAAADVVLLDLKLPDSDDLSLLRRVRAASPGCRVIMMTAHGTPEILAEALHAGAFRTVAKPFDLGQVVGLVREAAAA
jgi:DNA-binding NtrC family response regulator